MSARLQSLYSYLLKLSPRQVLQQIADQRDQKIYWSGKARISVLIHNEDNDLLLYHDEGSTSQRSTFEDVPHMVISRETMNVNGERISEANDTDDAGKDTVGTLVRDLVMRTVHPANISGTTVLDASCSPTTLRCQIIVACRVQSAFLFGASMAGLRWLPEKNLKTFDIEIIREKLGDDGKVALFAALEVWKHTNAAMGKSMSARHHEGTSSSDEEDLETPGSIAAASEDDGYFSDEESEERSGDDDGDLEDLPDLIDNDEVPLGQGQLAFSAPFKHSRELVSLNSRTIVGQRRQSGFITHLGRFATPVEMIGGRRVVRRLKKATNFAVLDAKLLKGHAEWKEMRKTLQ